MTYMENVERAKSGTPLRCVGCAHRKQGLCCYAADTGEIRGESIAECTHYQRESKLQRKPGESKGMIDKARASYIGGQIQKIMEDQQLSQQSVADMTGVSLNSIYNYVHAEYVPRKNVLDNMIHVFNLPENYFDMPDGWKPPKEKPKFPNESKETRQVEQPPADWMAETATMIQGVALLYDIDAGDLIRDALKVWLQKRAEEGKNGE